MAKADAQQTLESQFVNRLKQLGYEVNLGAKVKGVSGTEHTFAIMAHKDDGLFSCDVAAELAISQREEVGLGAVFNFDEKANDAGIADRVFIAIPKLGAMAANFAQQEHIKVFDEKEITAFLNSAPPPAKHHKPIEFNTRAQLLKSLTERGYKIDENIKITGASGAEHIFDILVYVDDGLITHPISVDFLSADTEIGLEAVSPISARAEETDIARGVLLVAPGITEEARQFIQKRRVIVYEVGKAAPEKPAAEPQKPAAESRTAKKTAAQTSKESETVKVDEAMRAVPPVAAGSAANVAKTNAPVLAPSPAAISLVPERLARKYNAVPLTINDNTLRVLMANPDDILAIQALAAKTKKRIEPVPGTASDIQEAIDLNYKTAGETGKQTIETSKFGEAGKFTEIDKQFNLAAISSDRISIDRAAAEVADDSPIAKALNLLVEEAVKARSSDIHIEPEEDKLRVRYRIDGILHEVASLPIGAHGPLISRIKILAGMNIADPRRPQDGQFSLVANARNIDVRVATISTVHGETAVLRLLDKSMAALSLSQLGFLPEGQETFERMLMAPYGMLLLSGPTGAGKTTTLYAAVNSLDKVGRNIITIEDPVEYRFQGINQIQINTKAGVTFASGLRAIVRLDPDVILVGEIRDGETADIATQSALTGHLVLSSVHANDTIGVIFRLIDLGVEPFLICSAVICIAAQRMVRRVCTHCARKIEAPLVEQKAYHRETGEEQVQFDYGAGCKFCTYTGYLGRTGIFEILTMSDEIRRLIVTGATAAEIRARAVEEGMITLAKDGMLKAGAGTTTPHEVLRNAYTVVIRQ